jgi:hypothetical protein
MEDQDIQEQIEVLKKELAIWKARTRDLEKKLLLFHETGEAHINRHIFRSYVKASINREETDYEWMQFLNTFSFNSLPLAMEVYKWIDTFLLHKPSIHTMTMRFQEEIEIELESWPSED